MSVMKEGWTYKKLGEVCEVLNGFAFKSELFKNSGLPILRISNIQDNRIVDDGFVYFDKSSYPKIDLNKFKVYPTELVIAMSGATTGKVGINSTSKILYLNQRVGLLREDSSLLKKKFLFYFMQTKSSESLEIAAGVAQPNLSTKQIKEFQIPVPSLPTQQSIISELDKINELITLKKSQLKDLDSLSQSFFYEMFGDPITNEKEWDLSRLMDNVVEMFLGPFGSSLKVDSYVPIEESYCMVYEQKHAIQKSIYLDNHYINEEKYNSLSRFKVEAGDFIMSCRGTIGKLYRLPSNAPMGIIHPSLMKIRIKESSYNPTYFAYMLPIIVSNQNTYGNCVQMAITAKALGNMQLGLPPLSLQHQFAERVESIERMKQQVQTAIKDLETLLASRMQYWFD